MLIEIQSMGLLTQLAVLGSNIRHECVDPLSRTGGPLAVGEQWFPRVNLRLLYRNAIVFLCIKVWAVELDASQKIVVIGNMNLFDQYLEQGLGRRRRTSSGVPGKRYEAPATGAQRRGDPRRQPFPDRKATFGLKHSRKRRLFQLDDDEDTDGSPAETLPSGRPVTLTHRGKPLHRAADPVRVRENDTKLEIEGEYFDGEDANSVLSSDSDAWDDQPDDDTDLISLVGQEQPSMGASVDEHLDASTDDPSKPRFRDLVQHWIQQRQQAKQQKQAERLLWEQQTSELDATFRLLSDQLIRRKASTNQDHSEQKTGESRGEKVLDDYDRALLDMANEQRAQPAEPVAMREARQQEALLRLGRISDEAELNTLSVLDAPNELENAAVKRSETGEIESTAAMNEAAHQIGQTPASLDKQSGFGQKIQELEQRWQSTLSIRGDASLSVLLEALRGEAVHALVSRSQDRSASPQESLPPKKLSATRMEPLSAAYVVLGRWSLEQLYRLDGLLASFPEQLENWTQDPETWRRLWASVQISYSLSWLYPHQQARHPVIAPLALILSRFFAQITYSLERIDSSETPTPARNRSFALLLTFGHVWIQYLIRPSGRFWPEAYGFLRAILRHVLTSSCCPSETTPEQADAQNGVREASALPALGGDEQLALVDRALDQVYSWSVPNNTSDVNGRSLVTITLLLCEMLLRNEIDSDYPKLALRTALQESMATALLSIRDSRLQRWCSHILQASRRADTEYCGPSERRFRAKEPKMLNPRLDMDRSRRSSIRDAQANQRLRQQLNRERRATARVLRRRHEVYAAGKLQAENSTRARLQRRERQLAGLVTAERNQ
jgi:hypothetical protein